MKIKDAIEKLSLLDRSIGIICSIPKLEFQKRIYVVAQIKENIPGFVLDDREPEMSDLTVENIIKSLKSFSESFQENDLILQAEYDIDENSYQSRCFELTDIYLKNNEVVFESSLGEIVDMREEHIIS